ncbi:Nin one binding Zn-ribbon like-domain-containing protein [Xylaria bambusicola]|uniref:Nin one binding Zn-ribbon like-domain-containing protein n=1 Tax=Xylaria bambusicola TaxID=326684 RepID=UPI0020075798|nr:Nin one binding Zn-ribbon like-domain-containing protein [Xylaria bambusicola]KAI0513254.1 Nin one binding Zn-ribbon like-domain-containing protein [Xylaria bambusicola]
MATTEDVQNPPAAPDSTEPSTAETTPSKPIHALILDAGPLIKNDPPVSTLLAQANELYTLPSVVSEIRDAATRSRVETTLLPFLKLRSPRPASIKFVTDFARRTGDLEVLSKPDIHLMALAYELECELNGGDWRLRNTPGQKGVNGKSPAQLEKEKAEGLNRTEDSEETILEETPSTGDSAKTDGTVTEEAPASESTDAAAPSTEQAEPTVAQETITQTLDSLSLEQSATPTIDFATENTTTDDARKQEEEDDDEGWITPSNLKKHQAKDQLASPEQPVQRVLKVALLTSDYAMQNVLLRINLNLVSSGLARITRVKTWVLRCHGCFQITRDTSKQFCPRCGQATLTRVSCSTDQAGNFTIYLKKNFQWNNRGNVYSVPKPVHGSANGKARGPGGGKNGWGRELIFAEDQKEYERKSTEQRRTKQRDLMDDDYLPSILSGNRQSGPGKIKVGAGRNINSRKRF